MSQVFRWLDWDIENRPLSYLGMDYTTSDITVIAAGWCDEEAVWVGTQTKSSGSQRKMLKEFYEMWEAAGGVTGHNIRKHDLRTVNGALMEHGLPTLGAKLTQDTYMDLKKKSGISGSQENLCLMLDVPHPKITMHTATWREANRLTPKGIKWAVERCVGDVVQHKSLREVLLRRDLLQAPKVWRP